MIEILVQHISIEKIIFFDPLNQKIYLVLLFLFMLFENVVAVIINLKVNGNKTALIMKSISSTFLTISMLGLLQYFTKMIAPAVQTIDIIKHILIMPYLMYVLTLFFHAFDFIIRLHWKISGKDISKYNDKSKNVVLIFLEFFMTKKMNMKRAEDILSDDTTTILNKRLAEGKKKIIISASHKKNRRDSLHNTKGKNNEIEW